MLEALPDHDPIALRGRALSAEKRGDFDTARVFRAAGSEIERLRDILAERRPKPINLSEIEREFVADMRDENPPPEEPWRNFDPDYRQKDIARLIRRGWFERKIEGAYRSYRWTEAGRSALRAEREGE